MQYNQERQNQYSQYHGYAYDAIWAAAVTIKHVIHKLHERNKNTIDGVPSSPLGHSHNGKKHLNIADFIYRDAAWEKLFLDSLASLNFSGVTVQFLFILL